MKLDIKSSEMKKFTITSSISIFETRMENPRMSQQYETPDTQELTFFEVNSNDG